MKARLPHPVFNTGRLAQLCIIVAIVAGTFLAKHIYDDETTYAKYSSHDLSSNPTADPDAGDRGVLANLAREGSDVSQPTSIRHYLYFPSSGDANATAALLRSHGYETDIEEGHGWIELIASIDGVPSLANELAARALLNRVAHANHGYYANWDASLAK